MKVSKKVENIIKSIKCSNRPINSKNIKFEDFKEILISENCLELFNLRTKEFQQLVIDYQHHINKDNSLNSAKYYYDILTNIKNNRINQLSSSQISNIVNDKLKKTLLDSSIEEDWRDRGYTHMRIKNGTVKVKITDKTQLEYEYKMFQLDTVSNIISSITHFDSSKLPEWYEELIKYCKTNYNSIPKHKDEKIFIGGNGLKSEMALIYYCLTDAHIYIINRLKFKN